MSIFEVHPYDLDLVSPAHVAAAKEFWAKLPTLCAGTPTVRLLMIASTFEPAHVLNGFRRVSVREQGLPTMVKGFKSIYESHVMNSTQATRSMRLMMVFDSKQGTGSTEKILRSYGLRARGLDETIQIPFKNMENRWNRGVSEDGRHWAVVESLVQQSGVMHLAYLHSLLSLGFPLWMSLDVETIPKRDSMSMLKIKSTSARYEQRQDIDAQEDARDVSNVAVALRKEIQGSGMALHHFRLRVLVSGGSASELNERLQIVRSSSGIELQNWESEIGLVSEMFSSNPPVSVRGSLTTTRGILAAAGSPLVFRRRTSTRGVLIGQDSNQSPVIMNLFDPSNPSYNMICLGQSGSGKTFSIQLIILRHMLMGCRAVMVDPQGNIDWSFMGRDVTETVTLGTEKARLNILEITDDDLPQQVETVLSRLKLLEIYGEHESDSLARTILDRCLTEMYEPIWGTNVEAPTLVHLQRRLKQMESDNPRDEIGTAAKLMAYRLSRYTEGSQADLFCGQSNVDLSLSAPITVFDISRLPSPETEGNLRAALLSILVGGTSQGIKRLRRSNHPAKNAPMIWFIDEMGVLMRDPVIASNTSYEFKTARARQVSMIVADQDLHSLLGRADEHGTHHGLPMLSNAAMNMIFFQKGSERGAIDTYFPDLPPTLKERIFHQGLGQCVMQMPGEVMAVNIQPSPFEAVVLSSRQTDRERRDEIISKLRNQLGD